jgi:hypothetical protein
LDLVVFRDVLAAPILEPLGIFAGCKYRPRLVLVSFRFLIAVLAVLDAGDLISAATDFDALVLFGFL